VWSPSRETFIGRISTPGEVIYIDIERDFITFIFRDNPLTIDSHGQDLDNFAIIS
jgi:hypothetical protein